MSERRVTAYHARRGREAFALGRALRAAVDDRSRASQLLERVEDRSFAQLHAERAELHRQYVSQLVDDQARQLVAFGVDEPYRARLGRRQPEPLLTVDPRRQLGREQLRVQMAVALAREDSDRYRRAGRIQAPAHEVAA